jgi:SAM-dependent methyltransferase
MDSTIHHLKKKLLNDMNYSVRRFYVDSFFLKKISCFPEKSKILDIGGKKINKRGLFNVENYNLSVQYANIDVNTKPDFCCDASKIPVDDNSFDGVIITEEIEHLEDPRSVLHEAYRLLKPGGILLACSLLCHIHFRSLRLCKVYRLSGTKNNLSDIGVFNNIR